MIAGGLGGSPAPAAGSGSVPGFPQIPLGSPGEIDGIARSLQQAATDLDSSQRTLLGAEGTLYGDWQGDAASAYMAASGSLAGVVSAAATTFREVAGALNGYAGVLDRTQSEMGRLRGLYEGAVQRQALASSTVGGLTNALGAATKPAQVHQLQGDITRASGQVTDAGDEASGYVRQAVQLLDEFHREESRYMQVVQGGRIGHDPSLPVGSPLAPPIMGAGIPGVGFGVPYFTSVATGFIPGGLDPFNGVAQVGDPWNSPIPGYGVYMDSITPEVEPTNDLTDAITFFAAPVAAGPIDDILANGATAIAERFGIGSIGRQAVDTAEQDAIAERFAAGNYRTGDPLNTAKMREVYDAGTTARIDTEASQAASRKTVLDQAVDGAGKSGRLPLPPGATDIIRNGIQNSQVYVPYIKQYAAPAVKVVKTALGWLVQGGG